MSVLNNASAPMSSYSSYVLRPLQTYTSSKQSKDLQALLTELFRDLKAQNQGEDDLHPFILSLAALLDMNALETATWWHLLKRYISPCEGLKTALRLTGFHVKCISTDKRDQYLAKLVREDEDFGVKYAHWCSESAVPQSFSLTDIHTAYVDMQTRILRSNPPKRIFKPGNKRRQEETSKKTSRKQRKSRNSAIEPSAPMIQPIPINPVPSELPTYDELEVLYFSVCVLLTSIVTPNSI